MKLLTFKKDGAYHLGIVTENGVLEAGISPDAFFSRGFEALDGLTAALAAAGERERQPEAALTAGPAVPNPGKIICVGLNYRRHAVESGMDIPTEPILFSKFNNALAAHGEEIRFPAGWARVDYEAELGVVIGRPARDVPVEAALSCVLGYCNANDVSERDLQFRSSQWLLGKTPDQFMPLGPYVVTRDEVPDPQELAIKGWLNGEQVQDSTTADMVFSVAEIIAYASQFMTLTPGDIILTGTPEGVAMGRPDGRYLRSGDEYSIEVEGLGRLVNRFVGTVD